MNASHPAGVTDTPRLWLRAEGLAVLCLAVWLYARSDASWGLFALLFLVPDVGFVGYLAGARAGAVTYNLLHSYVGPLAAAAVALASGRPASVALIWAAHIGFDRMLGYGLKYPTAFRDTHLGRLEGGRIESPDR